MNIWSIEDLVQSPVQMETRKGNWVPARPLPGPMVVQARARLKAALLVLTGRYDLVHWNETR